MGIGRASKEPFLGLSLTSSESLKSLPRSRNSCRKGRRCQGWSLSPKCGIKSKISNRSPSNSCRHHFSTCKSSSKTPTTISRLRAPRETSMKMKRPRSNPRLQRHQGRIHPSKTPLVSKPSVKKVHASFHPSANVLFCIHCCSSSAQMHCTRLFLHRFELAAHALCSCCDSKLLPRVTAQLI